MQGEDYNYVSRLRTWQGRFLEKKYFHMNKLILFPPSAEWGNVRAHGSRGVGLSDAEVGTRGPELLPAAP